MEKPADVAHPVHELIEKRWSPIWYSGKAFEPDTIRSLFEAARWAPSCFNEQPWNFMIATRDNSDEFKKMLDCLVPGNQMWASSASLLILTVTKLTFTQNDKPNRWAHHDIGLAAENLVLQATALGLQAHQMGGFDGEKAKQVYNIPDGYEVVTAIAVGYPGAPDELPDNLRERELAKRQRKSASEFVFSGAWGTVSPAIEG